MKKESNVVSMDDARWKKELDRKEDKVDAMRERFAKAFPTKATPVKDFLNKKKRKKKR